MNTVNDILKGKGGKVWSISPEASVYAALQLMADKKIGAVAVTDNDKLLGLFTETDYVRKVILHGHESKHTKVKDIMTTKVVYASPDENIEECMAVMTAKRTRHLPVLEGDKLVGIISIGDTVKHIIADQKFTIEQLERYITS